MEEVHPESVFIVPANHLIELSMRLRDDPELSFDCLMCLSGLETEDQLQTVYHLYSMKHGHKCTLKCGAPKENPTMPTVSSVWATADWHERESFDLVGIQYEGHPDPRRILCPDDWEGHPLRKDYVPQTSWHGIPLTVMMPEGEQS